MSSAPQVPFPEWKKYEYENTPLILEEIEDVSSSTSKFIRQHYGEYLRYGIIVTAAYELLMGYWIISSLVDGTLSSPQTLILLLIPFLIYGILTAMVSTKIRHEFFRQFAHANHFQFRVKGWETGLDGAIFRLGHSHKQEDIVLGSYRGRKMTLLNFSYTIGSGKSSRSYQSTIFEIEFEHLLPPALLLVDRHYFGGLAPQFTDSYKYSITEEYDKHFDLYLKKKFEMEALQVFTPDFMDQTRQKWNQFSLEFADRQLYIYSNKIITKKAELQSMLELAKYLVDALEKKLQRIDSSLKAMASHASGGVAAKLMDRQPGLFAAFGFPKKADQALNAADTAKVIFRIAAPILFGLALYFIFNLLRKDIPF